MITRTAISSGCALALVAVAGSAVGLTPISPCDGAEGGMIVSQASDFGYAGSGFVVEHYTNLDKDGIRGAADGPVAQLNGFDGMRITECRSGRIIALDRVFHDGVDKLTVTEFLRGKVQAGKRFTMRGVETAAEAIYAKNDYVRIVKLRETEETCACREFVPGAWAKN